MVLAIGTAVTVGFICAVGLLVGTNGKSFYKLTTWLISSNQKKEASIESLTKKHTFQVMQASSIESSSISKVSATSLKLLTSLWGTRALEHAIEEDNALMVTLILKELRGHEEILKLGAIYSGETPLTHAIKRGKDHVVEVLKQEPSLQDATDSLGFSPQQLIAQRAK